MAYYIGIDGGGTKTAFCAVREDAGDIRGTVAESSSWRELGVDAVVGNIRQALSELLGPIGAAIGGVVAGMPCYGESAEGDRELEAAFAALFPGTPHLLVNDVEVGWAGSMAMRPGVNIVAGTGSIAFGRDSSGKSVRSGGWDEFFSDEGSCYWLGRRTMELFCKQADGRIEKGALYEIVRRELGLSGDFAFIDYMRGRYIGRRDAVASFQLLLEKAALAGDESAKALYREAVDELLMLIEAVRGQLSLPDTGWEVSYSGGLFKAGELVIPHLRNALGSLGGMLVEPRHSPVEGAALMAFDRYLPEGLPALQRRLDSDAARHGRERNFPNP